MISGLGSSISSMASSLFARLDTKSQGYIEKTDLQSAFEQISGASDADEIFSALDGDSDGKLTESELTSSLTKLAEELDNQFNAMRMSGAMAGMGGPGAAGGMPPPPPPQDDEGFTQDELSAQLEEIGSTDSKRSSLISSIVENFDQADTDGNGKVSHSEAMAFEQESGTGGSDSTQASGNNEFAVMLRMMQLAQAYGAFGQSTETASVSEVA
ncbi:EF-hand domain-containing protein [Uliginosibacterium sp. TH139]|uniref:EF-hand domain-containing protein n=1 Tax=Uliginosibacterium sp. TH139 TaxID=2067453 RepID=UPI000C798262|nr:EF-hand domain-containing protein [Uliginosibacterium sp. TH139]PLK48622.1 calcium-binding protein [Uliginosibacterium sp. TH139]